MPYPGEFAALSTALFWAFTSIFFSEAGRRIGSFNVNRIRLVMAVLIYVILMTLETGSPIPANINAQQFFWLGLSGIMGLVIGDSCGFKSLVMIGPRLTTLLYSLTPIMTSIIAWLFLGEKLRVIDTLGVTATVAGIVWVVTERRSEQQKRFEVIHGHPDSGSLKKGILLGIGAAFGQAVGLVLAKQGMIYSGGYVEAMPASYIRMVVAMVCIWIISAFRGKLKDVIGSLKDAKAIRLTFGGTFFGPFLGVWMSLVALEYIKTGVASTLNAMTPIMIIPLMIFLFKEKISARALFGAVLAVGGVTLLFLT